MTPSYRPYEPPALPAHVWLRMPGKPALPTLPDRCSAPSSRVEVEGFWDGVPGKAKQLAGYTDPPLFHYGNLLTGHSLCGRPIDFHNVDFLSPDGMCARPPIERRCLFCYRQQIALTGGLPSEPGAMRIPRPDILFSVRAA